MENKQTWKFLRKCNPRDSLSTCPLKKSSYSSFSPPPLLSHEASRNTLILRCRLKEFVTVAFFFFFHIFTLLRLDKIFRNQENRKFAYICTEFISIRFRTKLGLMTIFVDFQKGKFDRTRNMEPSINSFVTIQIKYFKYFHFSRFFFLSSMEKPFVSYS